MHVTSADRSLFIGILLGLFSLSVNVAAADPIGPARPGEYALTNLGSLGGNSSMATGINNRGQVVGWSRTSSGETHAYLWQDGIMTDLGTPPSVFPLSLASDINERGEIVGASRIHDRVHPVLWSNEGLVDLGTLGGIEGQATSINDLGQIVGWSYTEGGPPGVQFHAFLWEDGQMVDLGTLGGYSEARSINNRGQIVGRSRAPSGEDHAFLWQDGVMIDLGVLEGTVSAANDINARGQVAGWTNGVGGALWERGEWSDLGDLDVANAMNEQGQVVGSTLSRAVLLDDRGTVYDLGAQAGRFSSGFDINESGYVVGYWTNNAGEIYAALWSRSHGAEVSAIPVSRVNSGEINASRPLRAVSIPTLHIRSTLGSLPVAFEIATTLGGRFAATVYDAHGRLIRRLDGLTAPGVRHVWDGRHRDGTSVASGIYFLQVEAEGQRATRKLVITR